MTKEENINGLSNALTAPCGFGVYLVRSTDVLDIAVLAADGSEIAKRLLKVTARALRELTASDGRLCLCCPKMIPGSDGSSAFMLLLPLDTRVATVASPICDDCVVAGSRGDLERRAFDALRHYVPGLVKLPEPTHVGGHA